MTWKLAIKALQKGVGSMDYADCLLMEQDENAFDLEDASTSLAPVA